MPVFLVATPIGDPQDLSERALRILREADVVIGEERKEVSKLLKFLGIEGKQIELLNEHTKESEIAPLVQLCRDKKVALVSDCGTPGFCDPGARLVAACRAKGIASTAVPGASSLMCLLSLAGLEMREFLFRGFLPAEREARGIALNELKREKRPIILMDTPYRLKRLMAELSATFPNNKMVLGCDLTQPTEAVLEGTCSEVARLVGERKAEFMLILFPPQRP